MSAGRVTLLHAMPAPAPHVERNESLVAASVAVESDVAASVVAAWRGRVGGRRCRGRFADRQVVATAFAAVRLSGLR